VSFTIRTACEADTQYSKSISEWYVLSSQERGVGIATRTVAYLDSKILSGDSIIALDGENVAGFCYIETFDGKQYVSNSGLIVKREYRGRGLSKVIKQQAFNLARDKYPDAKIFGITTSDIVMKINSELGYRPVAFHQLTKDEAFWKGCSSCKHYEILMSNEKKMCLCTGMLAPSKNSIQTDPKNSLTNESSK
jgi:hypothetical protein